MGKYCPNCGNELNEKQNVCLKCGVLLENNNIDKNNVNNPKSHNGYIKTSSIIMIVLGAIMVLGGNENSYLYDNITIVFILPGLVAIIAGILGLCSIKNKKLLLTTGILLLIGALLNFIGIINISIFSIFAVIFGVFDIIYSREK